MKRMGYVLGPTGAPLALRPVEVRNNATGALITTGATDSDGRWEFDLADEAPAYKVEIGLGGASPQKVAQAPASIELEYLFVRYGLKARDGAVIDIPGFDPADPPGTGALDPRYVQKAGDSMAGALALANGSTMDGSPLITQATGDARFVNVTGDAMSGDLTLTSPAKLVATARGHQIGALGPTGAAGAVLDTDAGILLYRTSANNWSGLGGDGSGNMWWRTGQGGTPVPSLQIDNLGNTYIQRGVLYALDGVVARRLVNAAHGLINFGNTGTTYLNWDATALRVLNMKTDIDVRGVAGAGQQALTLNTSEASYGALWVANANSGISWLLGVSGTGATLGPSGSFAFHQAGFGSYVTIRANGGQVSLGDNAFVGAAAVAQLDVKAALVTSYSLIVRAHASHSAAVTFFQARGTTGAIIFGTNSSGIVSDVRVSEGAGAYTGACLRVYDSAGNYLGKLLLYA